MVNSRLPQGNSSVFVLPPDPKPSYRTQPMVPDVLTSAILSIGPTLEHSMKSAFGRNFAETLHAASLKRPFLFSFDAEHIRKFLKAYRRYEAQGGFLPLNRFIDGEKLEKLVSYFTKTISLILLWMS